MALIDRFLSNLRKAGAAAVGIPAGVEAAERAAGMDTSTRLGPSHPIAPAEGFSTIPRALDYRAGYNIAGRPRVNEPVSFVTMRNVIDSYDVAQICITHRIDSIRSYDWMLSPAPGVTEDVQDAIRDARFVIERMDPGFPDLGFDGWLSKYLYDVLAFDAGTLYRVRSRGGSVVGLRVVDGTTIAPLLSEDGTVPGFDFGSRAWAPAYVQYVQGMTWAWYTQRDMVYAPFRPISNSPYGRAPIETVMLNANTDLRFQVHFLQRFTDGNIPEGFLVAPETWTPDQLDAWQARWDAFLKGDQAALQQIKIVPGGSKLEWSNRDPFSSEFSQWLMRKTASAYHVSPNELGFTDDVNRSTGDTQVDVQERIGDLPLMKHVQKILTRFLQDDLGVPLVFRFDTGNDDADNLALAQSDKTYIELGVVSPSDVAELRFGKTDPDGSRVPRFIMTAQGPVPLSTLMQMSAPVDQGTEAPVPGSVAAGSIDPTMTRAVGGSGVAEPVTKALESPARAELSSFARFVKGRRKAGVWRDFEFQHTPTVLAHRLNVAGFGELRKDAGLPVAAGLAVVADDTGRVLMLQRALDPDDPAGGALEFPGGHVEPGEVASAAAVREWAEETGLTIDVPVEAGWVSGVYAGFVARIPAESDLDIHDRVPGVNPDDPDGDAVESILWVDPADLPGNPMLRRELAADLESVLESVSPPFVKAAWRDSVARTPQARFDIALTDAYTPRVREALDHLVDAVDVDGLIARAQGLIVKDTGSDLIDQVRAWAQLPEASLGDLQGLLSALAGEAFATGAHAAAEQLRAVNVAVPDGVTGVPFDWDSWKPGDDVAAGNLTGGGLRRMLDRVSVTVRGIADTVLETIGTRIGRGVAAGTPSDVIARDIRATVGSRVRAERIAHTEVARAQTAASMTVYDQLGVDRYDLVLSEGACERCRAVAAAGPYTVGDPAGEAPVHPFCRCANSPHLDLEVL